ncbi:hypothetical protein ACVMIH_001912 [Bradyrhizobium sp. USDA 4503]
MVVEITHRIGPTPSRKKAEAGEQRRRKPSRQRHHGRGDEAGNRAEPDHGAERQPLHHAGREQRTDHHADAVHRKRGADAGGAEPEMAHRIGHEHGEQQERRSVEDELGDEHRPQQGVVHHEGRAFLYVLQRMAPRGRLARRLVDAGEQHDRDRRQCRGEAECGRGPDPADQHAAERGAAGERDGTRELDAGVRRRQLL